MTLLYGQRWLACCLRRCHIIARLNTLLPPYATLLLLLTFVITIYEEAYAIVMLLIHHITLFISTRYYAILLLNIH